MAMSPMQSCEGLLSDELARLYLLRTINVSAPLERLLTACRARWLADAVDAFGEKIAFSPGQVSRVVKGN